MDFIDFMNQPAMRALMRKAILARPATAGDDTSDVLVVGRDFWYLVQDEGNQLAKLGIGGGPMNAPERIVIDADSFLAGIQRDGHPEERGEGEVSELVAIHDTDGRLFRVMATPVHLP